MRAVVQRVTAASVTGEDWTAHIAAGVVAFVGVERGDGPADVEYIARKIHELRIFGTPDGHGFDRSVQDIGGQVLVISQFTLLADCRKGRRPAFDAAAAPEVAKPLYESVVLELRRKGAAVETGRFQAAMQVQLTNDGPVTLLLDSRKRE